MLIEVTTIHSEVLQPKPYTDILCLSRMVVTEHLIPVIAAVLDPLFSLFQFQSTIFITRVKVDRSRLLSQPRFCQDILDINVIGTIENRSESFEAQCLGCPAKMGLQHLADIHTRRDTNGIEDNIHRSTVGQERHLFSRGYNGDDSLVTVASGKFIAHRISPFLSNPYLYQLVHPGGKVAAREFLHIDNLPPFTVRYAQGCIFNLPRFLTKDSPQQFFFG